MVVASILVVSGSVLLGTAMSASSPRAHFPPVTPNTGLANGPTVTMTGSGLTPRIRSATSSSATAIPTSPTVHDGGVVNSTISVSCTAPSFSALVTTTAKGDDVGHLQGGARERRAAVRPGSIRRDLSRHRQPGKARRPTPRCIPVHPTPAQQAIGDVCTLTYGDQANDSGVGQHPLRVRDPATGATTTTKAGATTTTGRATTTTGGATTTTTAPPPPRRAPRPPTEGATTTTEGATTTTEAPPPRPRRRRPRPRRPPPRPRAPTTTTVAAHHHDGGRGRPRA